MDSRPAQLRLPRLRVQPTAAHQRGKVVVQAKQGRHGGMVAGTADSRVPSATTDVVRPLRLVTFLAPDMLAVYRFLADRIGDRLRRPVALVAPSTSSSGRGRPRVICGLPYGWLAARPSSAAGAPRAGP